MSDKQEMLRKLKLAKSSFYNMNADDFIACHHKEVEHALQEVIKKYTNDIEGVKVQFMCGVCDRERPELVNTNLDVCFDCMDKDKNQ